MAKEISEMLVISSMAKEVAGHILALLDYAGENDDVALDSLLFHLDTWERPALLDAIQAKLNQRG